MHHTRVIAALFVPFLALGACGGDDDPEFTQENLSSELVKANLLEQDAADCVAESVFDELSDEQVENMGKTDFEGGADLPPELQAALTTAIQSCVGVDDGTGDAGTDDGS